MARIASWLAPGGQLFVHIFTHRDFTYLYDVKDDTDWMAKYFFTGDMMPSDHRLLRFLQHLRLVDHWRVSGRYAPSCGISSRRCMEPRRPPGGWPSGGSSSWPARSFGPIARGRNGW